MVDTSLQSGKSLKVIKDHHKQIPIVNIKFADWAGPQGKYYGMVTGNKGKNNNRESQ